MKQDYIIRAENLSIGYDNKIIMRNLSFDIPKGDIFIIMGGSGCGKSTLLRTLTGLIPKAFSISSVTGISRSS